MKKIFFFALASLALASCSQDEEFVAEKTNGSNRVGNGALSFSTYTASATRANVVDAAAIKASGFQIAAVYDNALYFNAGETAKVSTDVDNLNHELYDTQQDTYYWPSFSAGAMGFRGFNLGVGATWKNEYHDINFTLGTTASSQKDLVIAYDSVSSKPTTHGDGVQPLNFTHALSKINFSFAGDKDGNKYTINKVEVIAAGVPTSGNTSPVASFVKGELTTAPAADATQSAKVVWDFTKVTECTESNPLVAKNASAGAAQGVLFTYDFADDVVVDGTTATKLDEDFMLLPQKGKIAVRVYYKVETLKKNSTTEYNLIGNCGYSKTDAQGHHDATDGIYGFKTVIIDLGATTPVAIPAWEAGKAYRFTLTLPSDNFIGDISGDEVPDGSDDAQTEDYDGDGDKDKSEFDVLTPIRFCVTVSAWETAENNTNITIK